MEEISDGFVGNLLWDNFIRDLKDFYSSIFCSVRTLSAEKPANVSTTWEPLVFKLVTFTSESVVKTPVITEDYSMVWRKLHGDPKLSVVCGPSGSGKTTVVKKVVMDWSLGSLPHISLLMAIPSSFLVCRVKNGFDLGEIFIDYLELCGQINHQIELRRLVQLHVKLFCHSTLLIADHNVLSKNNDVLPCRLWADLPCHTVLTTNRSAKFLFHLSRKAVVVVDISGFSKERALGVAEKFGGVKLGHLLTDHPYLWNLCESPLLALMVAEVFLESKATLLTAESVFDVVYQYARQNLQPYGHLLGVDSIGSSDLRRVRFVQSLGRYAFEILTYSWKYEMLVELSEAQIWGLFLAGILVCRETGKLNFSHSCYAEFFASLYVSGLLELQGSPVGQLRQRLSRAPKDHWKKIEDFIANPATFALFSRDHKLFFSFLRSAAPKWYDYWFSRK